MPKHIRVRLRERSYFIHVGRGALGRLRRAVGERPVVVVSSPPIWTLHGSRFVKALGQRAPLLAVPDGEAAKSVGSLERLWRGFARAKLPRDGVVVAFGGGVVGDLAGFAAATWQRGVDWIAVPTTLLAMVDSSVGGKTAVNLASGKNLVGAFHQPRAVVADTALLATLPARERQSGSYEILKCGLIADRRLFATLEGPGLRGALEHSIAAACRIKARVVTRDEREGGLRRVLNLGHTLGHALEAAGGYRRFTHGEAVGWGLIGAAAIAREKALLRGADFERVAAAVDRLGPRPSLAGLPARAIRQALARDKKVRAGRLSMVLPRGIGRVVIRDDVTPGEIEAALSELRRR